METNELKENRYKLIKNIFRYEYNALIILSLLTFASFFLIFAFQLVKYFIDANMLISYNSLESEEERVAMYQQIFNVQLLFGGIFIIVSLFSFIVFGGVVHYLIDLFWNNEKPKIKSFFEGIKHNFKYGITVGIIVSFIYNLCLLFKWGNNTYFYYAYLILIFLSILFIYPVCLFTIFEGDIYQGKLLKAIKNAFILYLSEPLKNILIFICLAIPIILFFAFQSEFVVYFLLAVLMVYGFGILLMLAGSRIMLLLDRYVNKMNYPDLYQKGKENIIENK